LRIPHDVSGKGLNGQKTQKRIVLSPRWGSSKVYFWTQGLALGCILAPLRGCLFKCSGGSLHPKSGLFDNFLAAYVDHGPGGGDEVGLAYVMAGLFLLDYAADKFFQLLIACTSFHLGVEVVVPDGE